MAVETVSEKLKQFIFEHIDSVEQLEVLLFLRKHSGHWYEAGQISSELSSTPQSVILRLHGLEKAGLIEKRDQDKFRYDSKSSEIDQLIGELSEAFRVKRHKILELIFSPMKRARPFADAFRVGKIDKKSGEEDG